MHWSMFVRNGNSQAYLAVVTAVMLRTLRVSGRRPTERWVIMRTSYPCIHHSFFFFFRLHFFVCRRQHSRDFFSFFVANQSVSVAVQMNKYDHLQFGYLYGNTDPILYLWINKYQKHFPSIFLQLPYNDVVFFFGAPLLSHLYCFLWTPIKTLTFFFYCVFFLRILPIDNLFKGAHNEQSFFFLTCS